MSTVYCDKCKRDFKIKVKTEDIENDIERVYFICPYCKTEYTSYYLNDDIKAKQHRMKILQCNLREATRTFDMKQMKKLMDMSKKLHEEIGRDMNNLKIKVERIQGG